MSYEKSMLGQRSLRPPVCEERIVLPFRQVVEARNGCEDLAFNAEDDEPLCDSECKNKRGGKGEGVNRRFGVEKTLGMQGIACPPMCC